MSGDGSSGSGIFFKPGGWSHSDAPEHAAAAAAPTPTPVPAPAPAPAAHPRSIGSFRITGPLGTGGMGVVFEAEQERPRRTVALKVIRSSVLGPKAIRRFEFEAEVLARLQHPGIAQIYEAGTFDEGQGPQPYFAMELVRGLPIDRYANEHSLGLEQRLKLLLQVCAALQHAHQRGVIHRDLKPANVFVDDAGQPRILDFGVAATTAADISIAISLSRSDFQYAAGTLPYLSPEQLDTEPRPPDARGDVYAMGVVAYELLTGHLPYEFRSGSLLEAAEIIREREPTRPSSFNRLLRGDVEMILRKAIEKDPEERYQSVSDLAADINRFLRHEPLPLQGPGMWYQARKFVRRNKGLVTAAAAVFLVLLAGITATSWQAVRATRSDRESRERFNELRRFARTVIFEVEPAIRDLPGSTSARWVLLNSTREYLDRAARDAADDPELLAELAAGYHQLARVQGMPATRNLGDVEGSLRSLRRSVELWEMVVRSNVAPHQATLELLTARRDVFLLLEYHNRYDEAIEEAETIRQLAGSRLRDDPSDLTLLWLFARACNELIAALQQANGHGDHVAQAIADEVVELVAACPTPLDTPEAANLLGKAHFAVAQIHSRMAQPQQALGYYDAAEPLLERAAREGPTVARALDHADVFRYRAEACAQRQDVTGAVRALTTALELYGRIAQAHPGDYATEQVTTTTESKLAGALLSAGEFERARTQSHQALTRAERLLATDPSSLHHRRTCITMKARYGGVLFGTAEDPDLTSDQRKALLLEARAAITAALEAIAQGRSDGSLAPMFEAEFAHLPGDLARCEEALAAPTPPDAGGP